MKTFKELTEAKDKIDTVTLSVPALLRVGEVAREDIKDDDEWHDKVEQIVKKSKTGTVDSKSVSESKGETNVVTFKQFVDENSPFNYKTYKSQIDWSDMDKKGPAKVATSTGTVYKAREGSRNAETGTDTSKEKKNVGRPAGEYGSYKIDKEKRNDPKYKAELAAKVRAAKAEGFAARDEFKKSLDAALKKRQLEIAGLDK